MSRFSLLVVCYLLHLASSAEWAVLIAGSLGWDNYRHQADVCHAYQVLKARGIPQERIITLMYDDIAYNEENPDQGKIYNNPDKVDVYAGVQIDYKGEDVNGDNFVAVLTGNTSAVDGVGTGRVLQSTANDTVFVFFSGHGDAGLICMPHYVELHAKTLHDALNAAHSNGLYGQLTFYLESCLSGSVFESLPANKPVYAVTAADATADSYATYCDEEWHCLGDEFSVHWIEDAAVRDRDETLESQFVKVHNETEKSKVCHFGDLKIAEESIGIFEGDQSEDAALSPTLNKKQFYETVPQKDVPLHLLKHQLKRTKDEQKRAELRQQMQDILEERENVAKSASKFAHRFSTNPKEVANILSSHHALLNLDCHYNVVQAFTRHCGSEIEIVNASPYLRAFVNLCEMGYGEERIVTELEQHCANELDMN